MPFSNLWRVKVGREWRFFESEPAKWLKKRQIADFFMNFFGRFKTMPYLVYANWPNRYAGIHDIQCPRARGKANQSTSNGCWSPILTTPNDVINWIRNNVRGHFQNRDFLVFVDDGCNPATINAQTRNWVNGVQI